MQNVQVFDVAPLIPAEISFLDTLSRNMWWCWNQDAQELFRRISPELWQDTHLNPRQLLMHVPQDTLRALAGDEGFLRHLKEVKQRFDAEAVPSFYPSQSGDGECICYFSLEYGLHESVRIYSGGLGVLAGDHLKAASDDKLPLVGVGLLYCQGYFQQYLDRDGLQQESYPDNQIHLLPLIECNDHNGQHLQIGVPLPEGELKALVWRLDVGRVPLFLLDTNIPDNPPWLRDVTAQLYGGDKQMRLRQELLLGIGGIRALMALGIEARVCHMNEGHAAFLTLARIAHLKQQHGLDAETAGYVVSRSNVFTTHTPVPAGNETFPEPLLRKHLKALEPELGLKPDDVIAWSRPDVNGTDHEPCMTVLGLRTAAFSNGVSKLHGEVARRMWSHLWPERPLEEVPIGHVTNGVHVPSWLSPELVSLLNHYIGPGWRRHPSDPGIMNRIDQIPDEELWHAHETGRSRLIRTIRRHVERQFKARNATEQELAAARTMFDHETLTVGFARRFATYKRATLLLHDVERLVALLSNSERPVQIVFAGKAHPADDYGKDFIRRIVQFARRDDVGRQVVFLENYDMRLGRRMVQGVDVWLNNPRRPQEASGTSGMKAALNGALNVSVLDGWWCEGYSADCGWAIGNGEEYEDHRYQDAVEAQALYNLLEDGVIPCFYDRAGGDVPSRWVLKVKAAMKMAIGFFTSHRMLGEYRKEFYEPAHAGFASLMADGGAVARSHVEQRKRFKAQWHKIKMPFPLSDKEIASLHVGDQFTLTSEVELGKLTPDDVDVQVYYGRVDHQNRIVKQSHKTMTVDADLGEGRFRFKHTITCSRSGRFGFTARVTPRGDNWKTEMPGFMTWAEGN